MVERFRRYWADTIGHTERTTDGQNDSNITSPPTPCIYTGQNKTIIHLHLLAEPARPHGLHGMPRSASPEATSTWSRIASPWHTQTQTTTPTQGICNTVNQVHSKNNPVYNRRLHPYRVCPDYSNRWKIGSLMFLGRETVKHKEQKRRAIRGNRIHLSQLPATCSDVSSRQSPYRAICTTFRSVCWVSSYSYYNLAVQHTQRRMSGADDKADDNLSRCARFVVTGIAKHNDWWEALMSQSEEEAYRVETRKQRVAFRS